MKRWNVRVHHNGQATYLGQVTESNEELARCAAISAFGITDEDIAHGAPRATGIHSEDEFDVSPA